MQDKNKDKLMKDIMALDFARNELVLFLDTHPESQKALREYHKINQELESLRNYYRENFGPLTSAEVNSKTDWTWVKSPWPWEN